MATVVNLAGALPQPVAVVSGRVATLQLDVVLAVETALRRCGKLPSTISGELVQAARFNLFLLLTNLANRGLNLWCIEKTLLPAYAGRAEYQLPLGTVDALNFMFRRVAEVELTKVVTSPILVTFTAASTFDTFVAEVSDALVAVEISRDFGVVWEPTALRLTEGAVDVPNGTVAVRFTKTSAALPTVTLRATRTVRETPLAKISRDRYLAIPSKAQRGAGEAVQYWFDKQLPPVIRVWPTSDTDLAMFVLYSQRQIQDVASLTDALEVPQRWYQAILAQLAANMALEIPPDELPAGREEKLSLLAAAAISEAERGESDGAPLTLLPNLRGYTR
jgi:hypothetical protein